MEGFFDRSSGRQSCICHIAGVGPQSFGGFFPGFLNAVLAKKVLTGRKEFPIEIFLCHVVESVGRFQRIQKIYTDSCIKHMGSFCKFHMFQNALDIHAAEDRRVGKFF